MDVLKILGSSVGSIVVLFLLTRLIGNKQMSQLNLFDYINGITIGSIAAEFATSLEHDFWKPLLAMVVYGVVTCLISLCSIQSMKLRRIFEGRATVLLEHDKLNYGGFRSARLDLCEFLTNCRSNGYFSLSELETVIFEPNGTLSFQPKAMYRPITLTDLNRTVTPVVAAVPVIVDGEILQDNLKAIGKNKAWLDKQLDAQHAKASEAFLAMAESDGTLAVYKKETTSPKQSRFQ